MESNIGELIDQMFKLREEKSSLNAEIKKINEQSKELELSLIDEMKTNELLKAGGESATATLNIEQYPSVENKEIFYKWAVSGGRFEFLQSRVSPAPVKEMFEKFGILPDGIKTYLKEKINLRRR